MEQVFPFGLEVSLTPVHKNSWAKGIQPPGDFKEGIVEKILEPGSFIISFADGVKIKARGSESLKLGEKVRVLFAAKPGRVPERTPDFPGLESGFGEGTQLSALIPLAFGGKGSKARLEVFVERQPEGVRVKIVPAVYFVFVVQTELMGEVQWSIHMKGRQLTLQVFSQLKENQREGLKALIQEVEKSLKRQGFAIMAPTLLLNQAFKVPAGFRLNVRG